MLGYLASHRGRAVSREEILTRVWRLDLRGRETRTIDVHIANLRAKLRDDAESPKVLLTVRALIDRLAPRLAARAEQADLKLITDTNAPAATAKLAIDVSAVEQILFNLVDNACKYAGPDATEKRHHNIVDYTIVPNPQGVSMIGTHQLLAAGRSGFRLEGFYGRHNLGNPHPVDPAKFFGGRPGDLNAVKDHRRSVVL